MEGALDLGNLGSLWEPMGAFGRLGESLGSPALCVPVFGGPLQDSLVSTSQVRLPY